jgi:hypothetical protein
MQLPIEEIGHFNLKFIFVDNLSFFLNKRNLKTLNPS